MNILILRLSSIGDIFHTFTILPDLKQAIPNASIDWLVDEKFKEVAELSPLIDNVISIPLREWKKNKISWLFNLIKFKKSIKPKYYDYIIDTQGLMKTASLAKWLFNGDIYGLDRTSAREMVASLFYDYKYRVSQKNIAIIRLRGLIAKIFNLNHDLTKIDFQIKQEDCGVKIGKFILFLHGTSKQNKKWPLKFWLEMANWLLENTQESILLTHSNQEELDFANNLIKTIANPRIQLINKLSFIQLVDLITKARLVIGVDTGFTHLANLLSIPTLAIYLASDPSYVGILENKKAHNFGGCKQQVLPEQLIKFIQQHQLLEVNYHA